MKQLLPIIMVLEDLETFHEPIYDQTAYRLKTGVNERSFYRKSENKSIFRNATHEEIEERREWIKKISLFSSGYYGTLWLKGVPLSKEHISDAKKLFDAHQIVPKNEAIREKDLLVIFREAYISASNTFKGSTSQNRDVRLSSESEFYGLIYSHKYKNPAEFVKKFLIFPEETRRDIVNSVNGIGYKTASFMHLLLGGRSLLTLDVHLQRQLSGIEALDLSDRYSVGRCVKKKTGKRWLTCYPETRKEYETFEEHVLDYFYRYAINNNLPSLLKNNNQVNGSLITCLLWGEAVKYQKKISTEELCEQIIESRKKAKPTLFDKL